MKELFGTFRKHLDEMEAALNKAQKALEPEPVIEVGDWVLVKYYAGVREVLSIDGTLVHVQGLANLQDLREVSLIRKGPEKIVRENISVLQDMGPDSETWFYDNADRIVIPELKPHRRYRTTFEEMP